jgi:hypothetical protein
MQEMRGMATAQGVSPFLMADFPARAPKRPGQVPPNAHQGTQSMAWGPDPA